MSAVPPFDPTCPWRATCKSRRIITANGLLRHLQRTHNLAGSGRAAWVSRLTNPADHALMQPCGGVATGYAPHASKPIPWGFTRAQPIQIHASDYGTLKMALFPPTSMSYLAFLDLRRLPPRKVPIHVPRWTPLQHPYSPSSTARAVHVPHHLVSISSSQE